MFGTKEGLTWHVTRISRLTEWHHVARPWTHLALFVKVLTTALSRTMSNFGCMEGSLAIQ